MAGDLNDYVWSAASAKVRLNTFLYRSCKFDNISSDEASIQHSFGFSHYLLLPPRILQPHRQIEHRLGPLHMVDAVRHKIAVALKLELLAGCGVGQ